MVGVSGITSLVLAADILGRGDDNSIVWPLTCSASGFQILDNQLSQDPCQVAWALLSTCNNPIPPGTPLVFNQFFGNVCLCNKVYYSLVYVCGRCTNTPKLDISWSQYSAEFRCQSPDASYPHTVPPNTSIPLWASQPLAGDGKVDVSYAELVASQEGPNPPLINPTPTNTPPQTSAPPPSSPTETSASAASLSTVAGSTASSSVDTPTSTPPLSGTATHTSDSTGVSATVLATSNSAVAVSSQSHSTQRESLTATSQTDLTTKSTPTFLAPENSGVSSGEQPAGTTASGSASATALPSNRRSAIGAILGGVFGGIAAVILVVCIFLCLARRRRRRREKEAMLASGPLDWWRQTDILPRLMKREPSESSTIKADDLDYDDDMETLHATSVEKKSVTYGEYPDL